MQPIIDMQGIVKRYYIGQPNERDILHGIYLQVYPGEFEAVVGESGSGKSTLMNIIGALDRPTEGSYKLDGVDITSAKDKELSVIRNRKIGFVFQTFNLIGRTSALKNVELPMLYGGQKQRVAIARALVNQPALLLADEPTGALDSATSRTVMDIFHQLHARGMTIVLITHSQELAAECERILTLRDGRFVGERKGAGRSAAV